MNYGKLQKTRDAVNKHNESKIEFPSEAQTFFRKQERREIVTLLKGIAAFFVLWLLGDWLVFFTPATSRIGDIYESISIAMQKVSP